MKNVAITINFEGATFCSEHCLINHLCLTGRKGSNLFIFQPSNSTYFFNFFSTPKSFSSTNLQLKTSFQMSLSPKAGAKVETNFILPRPSAFIFKKTLFRESLIGVAFKRKC